MQSKYNSPILSLLNSVDINDAKAKLDNKINLDPEVKIKIVQLKSKNNIGVWAAEIPTRVTPYVHTTDEWYRVIEGEGILYSGTAVIKEGKLYGYNWNNKAKKVKKDDVFLIKGNNLHMLENININDSKKPLRILFGGPLNHLVNDRFIVDSPKK